MWIGEAKPLQSLEDDDETTMKSFRTAVSDVKLTRSVHFADDNAADMVKTLVDQMVTVAVDHFKLWLHVQFLHALLLNCLQFLQRAAILVRKNCTCNHSFNDLIFWTPH